MSSRIINVDYIGTVCFENGKFVIKNFPVSHSTELLTRLKDCCQEEESTRQDLQEVFTQYLPEQINYNYCYPLDYSDRSDGNSGGGLYPIPFTRSDYSGAIDSKRKALIEQFPAITEATIEKRLEEFRLSMRKDYYEQCAKYIRAYDYTRLLNQLKSDSTIKVYSTEEIGYLGPNTYQRCQLGEDVKISISTNFAFGSSSYFILNLTYKGIPIYLYSKYVQYYFAQKVDIIECTNAYNPERDNWKLALMFVEHAANLALDSPQAFVQEYLGNELEKFMNGIRSLFWSPQFFIKQVIGLSSFQKNTSPSSPYVKIRHIAEDEYRTFKAYPHEMETSFRLDKLTGALEFLETLSQLEEVYPKIQDYIEEIKDINRSIKSDLEAAIMECNTDLTRLEGEKQEKETQLSDLKERMKFLQDELSSLIDSAEESDKNKVEEGFRSNHPELLQISSCIFELNSSISNLLSELWFRKQYRDWLTKDLDRIAKYA